MTDPLFRALEQEIAHLRQLRQTVLDILADDRTSREERLRAIEAAFEAEHDVDEEMEEIRDRERLS
jgi:hypothetical protein